MKTIVAILFSCALSCHAVDVVLGRISDLTWTGTGTDRVASFGQTVPWYSGLGLDSAWSVNEGSGTNIVDYISGVNGHTVGNPAWSTRGGLPALALDGDDHLRFGDVYDLGTNGLMLAAWCWLDAGVSTDVAGIIGKPYYGTKAGRYALYLSTGTPPPLGAVYNSPNGISNATCPAGATGIWCFVACTIERSGRATLYTNGVFCSTSTVPDPGTSVDTTDTFSIGVYDGGARYLRGAVRQACIAYNGTSNQMSQVWQRTRATYGK